MEALGLFKTQLIKTKALGEENPSGLFLLMKETSYEDDHRLQYHKGDL